MNSLTPTPTSNPRKLEVSPRTGNFLDTVAQRYAAYAKHEGPKALSFDKWHAKNEAGCLGCNFCR